MKHLILSACLVLSLPTLHAQTPAPVAAAESADITGKVVETMNTAGYTYVLVDTGNQKVWAAGVQFAVKVGDTVAFAPGQPMENYHSKTLNRDFALVYFTSGIQVNDGKSATATAAAALPPGHPPLDASVNPALPPGHPSLTGAPVDAPKLKVSTVQPAADGKTIEQIIADQAKLAGQTVTVRGQVVKYNAEILGKNWLHIRDGSGSAEKNNHDLTVTTDTETKVGDTVLVTGKLSLKKDFGGGYKYAVIIEDAKVVVE